MESANNPHSQNAMAEARATVAENRPDYARLFGSQELCDCEHCRSIYSPAAYLVELLQFLDPKLPDNATTPLDVLIGNKSKNIVGRRPDLAHIKLSCENTNTTLPYVDLVNEVLESYVAVEQTLPLQTGSDEKPLNPPVLQPNESSPGVTSLELGANPEHINILAYKRLLDAVYPFPLPFHQPLESLRLTLRQMGSSRQELIGVFAQGDEKIVSLAKDLETLSLSEADYVILTGQMLDATPQTRPVSEFYGLNSLTPSVETPWVDGVVPTGAITALSGGDQWAFAPTIPPPPSGKTAHTSADLPGLHQHYFHSVPESNQLLLDAEDILVSEVFLDPANPPKEILLQWCDRPGNNGGWEHRAYWSNSTTTIEAGIEGTESRRYIGPLPAAGGWVSLEVPAYFVGLASRRLHGMAFSLVDGSASWGVSGKRSATWEEQLSHVPVFLARTGITYVELVDLLRTHFINPLLPRGEDKTLNLAEHAKMLVLDAPDSSCDLNITRLLHLDRSSLGDEDWSRLHRLIRLWRRTGWSIQDLDRAFLALQASDITPTFLRQLCQVVQLQEALELQPQEVLSFFGTMPTTGGESLYEKLFLNKTVRNIDPSFQASDGNYLPSSNESIANHIPALLAGLRCRAADLELIRNHAGLATDTAPLTLANVTVLYRYITLARTIKLAVSDLIDLELITAVSPFTALSSDKVTFDPADIRPERTLCFHQIVESLSNSGWSPAQLKYIFSEQSEAPASLIPPPDSVDALLASIREGLVAIAAEQAATNDATGELTNARLSLIMDEPTAQQLAAVIGGKQPCSVPLALLPAGVVLPVASGVVVYDDKNRRLQANGWLSEAEKTALLGLAIDDPFQKAVNTLQNSQRDPILNGLVPKLNWTSAINDLEPTWMAADEIAAIANGARSFTATLPSLPVGLSVPLPGKISYDAALQQLKCSGAITASEREILLAQSTDAAYATALQSLHDQALTRVQLLHEQQLHWGAADQVIAAISLGDIIKVQSLLTEGRYTSFLQASLPYIHALLSKKLVGQLLTDSLKLDPAVITFLLEGTDTQIPLAATTPTLGAKPAPAITDFLSLIGDGLTATTFSQANWSGSQTESLDSTVQHRWPGKHAFSVRWQGTIISHKTERFQLHVRAGGSVSLKIGGDTLIDQKEDVLPVEYTATKELKAGEGYPIEVNFSNQSAEALLEIRWSGPTTPLQLLPIERLYSYKRVDPTVAAKHSFLRLHKVAALIAGFQLNVREISLLADPSRKGGLNLNNLPVQGTPTNQEELFEAWRHCDSYVQLRTLARVRPDLLPQILSADAVDKAMDGLSVAMGWNPQTLKLLAGPSPGFALTLGDFQDSQRLLALVKAMGLLASLAAPLSEVFSWAMPSPTLEETWDAAQQAKRALKARYDNDAWLQIIKPLSNRLRELQRNALVAFLLPHLGFDSPDQLFTHFLIDVEMSPCFQTSRIKQAISSVQLFIQCCLMNLIPGVEPRCLPSKRWEWMQNYRAWEANLKVYLYPENWIEPELRDDKTPFFKELESELLQSELTNDSAEIAVSNYLQKLETVSQLKICGMHEQTSFEPEEEKQSVLHVFGHTFASPRVFYYRQRIMVNANYYYWTPWERVPLEIEADEVLPVIWHRKLHLFWQIFFDKQVGSSDSSDKARFSRLAWSTYREGKWSAKQASPVDASVIIKSDTQPRISTSESIGRDSISIYLEDPRGGLVNTPPSLTTEASGGYSVRVYGHFTLLNSNGLVKTVGSQNLLSKHGYLPDGGEPGLGLGFRTFDNLTTIPLFNDSPGEIQIFQPRGVIGIFRRTRPYSLNHPAFLQEGPRSYLIWPSADQEIDQSQIVLPKDSEKPIIPGLDNVPALGNRLFRTITSLRSSSNPWQAASASMLAKTITQPTRTTLNLNQIQFARVINSKKDSLDLSSGFISTRFPAEFRLEVFFHPYATEFQRRLSRYGMPGLLCIDTQQPAKAVQVLSFKDAYAPDFRTIRGPLPKHDVDFSFSGAFSKYNWEVFFQIPLFVASRLSKEQRFQEAMSWFHYIFNPTNVSNSAPVPECYWQVLPFRKTQPQRLDTMLKALQAGDADMIAQWEDLQAHPFQPHRVARLRLIAYQKTVVMKYIDNLIAWADQDFRSDTIERINQATHRYILAGQIMGRRIQPVPPRGRKTAKTYAELRQEFKTMNLAMVSFENDLPFSSRSTSGASAPASTGLLGIGRSFYFCLPKNDKLLAYWDTIADRLFKIRHCMNIDGVVRELPLFEPAIDPALLVQAAAQGLDLRSVLADLSAPLPNQRFSTLLAKALEMAGELRALGSALLTALEKKDVEHLTNLRETNEREMMGMVRLVKEQQLNEAKEAETALNKNRDVIQTRFDYYANIQQVIAEEDNQLRELALSHAVQSQAASAEQMAADITTGTYDISTGISGNGPYFSASIGRANIIAYYQALSREKSYLASIHSYNANRSSILSGWKRRSDDWSLQKGLAAKELSQMDRQIAAAAIRVAIAKQELENTAKQIEQLQAIREYRQKMFTGEELQTWMVGELSALFFQFYQLTYDLAKKAEKASQYELGLRSSNFIRFGTWDSLHKGLLSGERLSLQLRQLEQEHHEANRRDYEITKEISLAQLDPLALIQLRELGWCEFSVPEELFDLDFPGHYMRRIKTVSLSIPAVVNTGVHCTLTLLRDKTRRSSLVGASYAEREGEEDDRFVINWAPVQAIATSSAINDSGLFELNLHDERTLPFEGAGAISHWRIELPDQFRKFDYNTISTVKLDLRYRSKDGGAVMKDAAIANLKQKLKDEEGHPQYRLISLRSDFPTEWYQLQQSSPDRNGVHQQTLCIAKRLFGFLFQVGSISISNIQFFGIPKQAKEQPDLNALTFLDPLANKVVFKQAPPLGTLVHLKADHAAEIQNPGQTQKEADWILQVDKTYRESSVGRLEDLLILYEFSFAMPQKR